MRGYFIYLMTLILICVACEKDKSSSTEGLSTSLTSSGDGSLNPSPDTGDDGNLPQEPDDSSGDLMVAEFMQLLNSHRQSLGLRGLVLDMEVTQVAETHSQNMADGKVAFGHNGFSSRCSESKAILGGGNLCSENVAMGQKSAQAVFKAWMNSSGHRANMESSRVTHTGFGYAQNSQGTYYWTQIFIEVD